MDIAYTKGDFYRVSELFQFQVKSSRALGKGSLTFKQPCVIIWFNFICLLEKIIDHIEWFGVGLSSFNHLEKLDLSLVVLPGVW